MVEVAMDAVGSAEDVLLKLIQERRALENAQKVLETYRMVRSELQPALDALAEIRQKIVDERRELQAVEQQRLAALKRVEEQVAQQRAALLKQLDDEVQRLKIDIALLLDEHDALVKATTQQQLRHDEELERYEQQLAQIKEEMEVLQSERGTLAEAIGRAAEYFKR